MQLLAKFKKILYMGFRSTLNFRKFNRSPMTGQFSDTVIVASAYKE